MRSLFRFPLVLGVLALAGFAGCGGSKGASSGPPAPRTFTLQSADLVEGGTIKMEQVFNGFGCDGSNLSPELRWTGAPEGTASFALIVHDPDAPTGVGGFTHWIVYDIPATATSLGKGAGSPDGRNLPAGAVQAMTSFGSRGYGGPCPPDGDAPHRYEFTLYALRVNRLQVPTDASQALIGFNVNANALAKTTLTGLYGQ